MITLLQDVEHALHTAEKARENGEEAYAQELEEMVKEELLEWLRERDPGLHAILLQKRCTASQLEFAAMPPSGIRLLERCGMLEGNRTQSSPVRSPYKVESHRKAGPDTAQLSKGPTAQDFAESGTVAVQSASTAWPQEINGVLHKRGRNKSIFGYNKTGAWKQYWFVLKKGQLSYYALDKVTIFCEPMPCSCTMIGNSRVNSMPRHKTHHLAEMDAAM